MIKYGATTLWADWSPNFTTSTGDRGWPLEFILAANGATNAQKVLGRFLVSDLGLAAPGSGDTSSAVGAQDGVLGPLHGTAAEDSTTALTSWSR